MVPDLIIKPVLLHSRPTDFASRPDNPGITYTKTEMIGYCDTALIVTCSLSHDFTQYQNQNAIWNWKSPPLTISLNNKNKKCAQMKKSFREEFEKGTKFYGWKRIPCGENNCNYYINTRDCYNRHLQCHTKRSSLHFLNALYRHFHPLNLCIAFHS